MLSKKCDQCKRPFLSLRSTKRFCKDECREQHGSDLRRRRLNTTERVSDEEIERRWQELHGEAEREYYARPHVFGHRNTLQPCRIPYAGMGARKS